MNNKRQYDIPWNEVPKDQKKKVVIRGIIIAICAVLAGVIICCGVGMFRAALEETANKLTSAEEVDLNGIGLEDILSWDEPEDYGDCQETVGKNGELTGVEWNDNDSMIFISMETYKGQCVMGFEEGDIDSYIRQEPFNLETTNIGKDGKATAYISAEPIAAKFHGDQPDEDWNPPEDSCQMEAVFEYGNYVISLRLEKFEFDNDGAGSDFSGALTDKQIETFYSMLNTIVFL